MLNWRDPWHPRAGGAELATIRILERLVGKGWDVEWFSGDYTGARDATINGIRYVHGGSQLTVHWQAFRRYRSQIRHFDVVVDQVNTIPFLAGLYAPAKTVVLAYQLAREVWFYETPRPFGALGYVVEPLYWKFYQHCPIITISKSSMESFRDIGLRGNVFVIPMAVDESPDTSIPKKNQPRDIVVVGRVTPSKRIEESIHAASILAKTSWTGRLHIVGGGDRNYIARLNDLVANSGIQNRVVFHGRVSNDARRELLRSSSVLWMTSVREGWGLVVTEAACHGTPAVVYNVPGLRDSVKDGVTGTLTSPRPESLAQATMRLFSEFERYAEGAISDARNYTWDRSAAEFENAIKAVLETRK